MNLSPLLKNSKTKAPLMAFLLVATACSSSPRPTATGEPTAQPAPAQTVPLNQSVTPSPAVAAPQPTPVQTVAPSQPVNPPTAATPQPAPHSESAGPLGTESNKAEEPRLLTETWDSLIKRWQNKETEPRKGFFLKGEHLPAPPSPTPNPNLPQETAALVPDISVSSGQDDQRALLAGPSGVHSLHHIVFQQRNTGENWFRIFIKDMSSGREEIAFSLDVVEDSAHYCPLTQEILFLTPAIDKKGKSIPFSKPRRVMLYSILTGKVEHIWTRGLDKKGRIASHIDATPDCNHVLVNLELETESQPPLPYGEIIYLRRQNPKTPTQSASLAASEWSFSSVVESSRSGRIKSYVKPLFLTTPEPYQTSPIPPSLVAVVRKSNPQEGDDLLVAQPKIPQKSVQVTAEKIRWQKDTFPHKPAKIYTDLAPLPHPPEGGLLLSFLSAEDGEGPKESGIVYFDSMGSHSFLPIITSQEVEFYSVNPHKNQTKILSTFEEGGRTPSGTTPRGGVLELHLNSLKFTPLVLERFMPWQGLTSVHAPRAYYGAHEKSVFVSHGILPEGARATIQEGSLMERRLLQFPVKVMEFKLETSHTPKPQDPQP